MQLTIQKATADAPLVISYAQASAGGDTWKNTGRERLRIRNNALPTATLATPTSAPTLAAAAGTTNLTAGVYTVGYSWGNASGETALGPTATVTVTAGQQINLSGIPALPSGATFAAVYVSAAAGSATLLRSGQTAGTTYSVTALPTGLAPYQAAITVTVAGSKKCNQGFAHPAVQTVNAGGASSELDTGTFDPFRFNDGSGNASLSYSSVGGLQVAVIG
jgi:hypothetical protein